MYLSEEHTDSQRLQELIVVLRLSLHVLSCALYTVQYTIQYNMEYDGSPIYPHEHSTQQLNIHHMYTTQPPSL